MTAQEFLKRAKGIKIHLELLDERILRLRANAERTTTSLRTTLGNRGSYDRYDYLAKADEAERGYSALNIVYEDALECIEQIDNRQYRDLLLMYYIDGMRWKEIGQKLNIGRTWVYVLHERALACVVVPDKYAKNERLIDRAM